MADTAPTANKGFQVRPITVGFLFEPALFEPTVICRLKRR